MYGLLGLSLLFGENVMSKAPLEIYLLGIRVTCSILILPAVYSQDMHQDEGRETLP